MMSIAMRNIDTTKKPARTTPDWHRADIKAALEKEGWSLAALGVERGYAPGSLRIVLSKPWPKAEKIIADIVGVPAFRIWPSRYHANGAPKSGRGERGLGRYKAKRSTAPAARNVHEKGAA